MRAWLARGRRALDRTLHAPAALDPALRFRRLLGAWTALYLALRLPHVEELYARSILRDAAITRVIDLGSPSPAWMIALLLATIALALITPWTRRARVGSGWVAGLFGVVLALEASPPRAYAILAWIQWTLAGFAPGPEDRGVDGRSTPGRGWGVGLLKLQYTSVYLFAGLAKLLSPVWWRGEAIVLVLRSPDYGGVALSTEVALPPALAAGIAWATILGELAIAIGLWRRRTRRPAIVAVVALHLSMMATIRISPLFHSLMLLHLVLFIGDRSAIGGRRSDPQRPA